MHHIFKKVIIAIFILWGSFFVLPVDAQSSRNTCITREYCCGILTESGICGFTLFKNEGGRPVAYVCDKQLPDSCQPTQSELCQFPVGAVCKKLEGGAARSPEPTAISSPSASPTIGPAIGKVKKSQIPVPYRPGFDNLVRQALFIIPIGLLIYFLF